MKIMGTKVVHNSPVLFQFQILLFLLGNAFHQTILGYEHDNVNYYFELAISDPSNMTFF